MARARVLEATRHQMMTPDDTVRVVIQFATDAGDPLGIRTVDLPAGSTIADLRTKVQAEFANITNATVAGLVGQTWQW